MILPSMFAIIALEGFGLLFIPFVLACTAFWVWMLVDSAKRKQFVWLVAIALTNVLGATAYFLLGRSAQSPVRQDGGGQQKKECR